MSERPDLVIHYQRMSRFLVKIFRIHQRETILDPDTQNEVEDPRR